MWISPLAPLLALVTFASCAAADYFIDDQNITSLLYSENPGGAKWGPFWEGGETLSITLANGTMMTIDASQCYNYTYTYAACTIADDCQVQIPFIGSGITVYVLQAGAQGINASLVVGGATHYNVLSPPPGPNFYVPNVTLFSVQGLASGNHTAIMTVLNWANIFSGMMFDYAAINETTVSPTATSSSSLTSSITPSISSLAATGTATPAGSAHSKTGAVVGGVVGGVVALATIFLAMLYFRRLSQRHAAGKVDIDAGPQIEPFLIEQTQNSLPGSHHSSLPTVHTNSFRPSSSHPPSSSSVSPAGKSRSVIANPNLTSMANSQPSPLPVQAGSHSNALSLSDPARSRPPQSHPMLTDDQADFINGLYHNNVPAAAIARVMERMMAGESRPPVEGFGTLQSHSFRHDSVPPPSYDHIVDE